MSGHSEARFEGRGGDSSRTAILVPFLFGDDLPDQQNRETDRLSRISNPCTGRGKRSPDGVILDQDAGVLQSPEDGGFQAVEIRVGEDLEA